MDNRRARLLHLATSASLAVAVTLVVAKALAWWHSGSVSLLAGLTDSLLDGAASLLNLLAVRYSLRPADDDHRYGHGKAESLSGMGQALFISVKTASVHVSNILGKLDVANRGEAAATAHRLMLFAGSAGRSAGRPAAGGHGPVAGTPLPDPRHRTVGPHGN